MHIPWRKIVETQKLQNSVGDTGTDCWNTCSYVGCNVPYKDMKFCI